MLDVYLYVLTFIASNNAFKSQIKKYKAMTIEQEYEYLNAKYAFGSSAFRMLYETFNRCVFCKDNRKQIIMDYLVLEDFVEEAKKVDFMYYYGIDEFLKEYHDAVYNCIKIDF